MRHRRVRDDVVTNSKDMIPYYSTGGANPNIVVLPGAVVPGAWCMYADSVEDLCPVCCMINAPMPQGCACSGRKESAEVLGVLSGV